MISYRPFELHNHTKHSDGGFLVPELLRAAKAYGYEGMALTDHNATTAALEVTPELSRETLLAIPGIEWTTFYGHMVVLGCRHFVDWRFVVPDTIDDALQQIRDEGGVAGVAHPCEVGSPLMCGCNWEFNVTRWDLVSYIEVWSAENPMSRSKNQLVMPWYDALLNEGHHLAISAGRDWHFPDKPGAPVPLLTATYLGIDGALTVDAALDALRAGRTFLTLGPVLGVSLRQGGASFGISETAAAGDAELAVEIDETPRREIWGAHGIAAKTVRLVVNGETADEQPFTGAPVRFTRAFPKGWLRAEVYGDCDGKENQLLALTSPIYFE